MTAICDKCKRSFDHYTSFYTDICDLCAQEVTGKSITELEQDDSKYDNYTTKEKGDNHE